MRTSSWRRCSDGGGSMAESTERVVDIWCEDLGHESVVTTLVGRVIREFDLDRVRIEVKNGQGGSSRVIAEFRSWQRAILRGGLGARPDVLIMIVDANSHGYAARKNELRKAVLHDLFPHVVIGCPDPHVESWLLLDPKAFASVTGSPPVATRPRGGEDPKGLFHACVAESGVHVLTGPMELAPDLIEAMDLDMACRQDHSLAVFIQELRAALKLLRTVG